MLSGQCRNSKQPVGLRPVVQKIRLYIHGGMHKTGTTSFQHLMSMHHDLLLEHGIYYPNNTTQHSSILKSDRPGWTPGPLREIIATAREKHLHTVILSGEAVSTLDKKHITLLTNCFPDCPPEFIFSFRHWSNYLPSRWSQNLIRRDSHSFSTYLARLEQRFSSHLDLQFFALLDRFRPLSRRLKAVSYDNAMQSDGSTVSAVLKAMDVPQSLVKIISVSEVQSNVRSGWVNNERQRLLNGIVADLCGLNQDDRFISLNEFRPMDMPFDLKMLQNKLPDSELKTLDKRIAEAEMTVTLSSRMPWIKQLGDRLQMSSANNFCNLHKGRIFPDEVTSKTRCTNLSWRDVDTPSLRVALTQLRRVRDMMSTAQSITTSIQT